MKILIIGAGEVGFNIARKLSQEHHDVVLIDQSREKIKRVEESLDVKAVLGSGTSPRTLKDAGIMECDLMVAATDSDEVNLFACLLAKDLNPPLIKIARVRNEEYLNETNLLSKGELGIDHVIDPGREMVKHILDILDHPWASDLIELEGGKIRLIAITVADGVEIDGISLRDLSRIDESLLVGAIVRKDRVKIPRGDDVIKAGDLVYFIALPDSQLELWRYTSSAISQTRRVIIAGAGNVGMALARALEHKKFTTKIIDKDYQRCRQMAEELQRVMVIKGNVTDKELLVEEDISQVDFTVALTHDEEDNILFSLLAKALGAKKAITRINRLTYLPLLPSIGIDIAVSSRLSAVKAILGFIRKGKVLSVTPIYGEAAELIEVEAVEKTPIVGRPIKDLGLPRGVLVGAIVREKEVIIPKGNAMIAPGDRLVMLAMEKAIPRLENLISRPT